MVNGLKVLGSDVKFTVYPEAGHDAWTETYANPELYDWLLSHSTKEARNFKPATGMYPEYAGKYQAADGTIIEVNVADDQLSIAEPDSERTLRLNQTGEHTFSYWGRGYHKRSGELTFQMSGKGKVTGFTTGPCEGKYYKRLKK